MKLACTCNHCGKNIELASKASSRKNLALEWGARFSVRCPHCKREISMEVNFVKAIPSGWKPGPTAILGAVIGVIAGPAGMVIGATIGGGATGAYRNAEIKKSKEFNNNHI